MGKTQPEDAVSTPSEGEAAIGTDAPATQEPASEQGTESAERDTAFDTDARLHSTASAGFQPEPVFMAVDLAAPEGDHTDVLVDDRTVLPLTRGRVVYYTGGVDDRPFYGAGQCTAHVVEVYSDRRVNLLVAHPLHGDFIRRNDVQFCQPDDDRPDTSYAEWMPFQVMQASRA